ncbi:MAG: hypothetical protein Q8L66_13130 [Caulobacter sp.]|nr:hypothetical protein [Caulobacter sp.]
MPNAYEPYAPLNVLKPVAPEVWIVDGPEIVLAYLVAQVEAVGPVRWLIAPNTLHYLWVPDWRARFPQTRFFGPPGLARAAKRNLPPFTTLTDEAPPDWADVIDQVVVGSLLNEVDVFYRPSRTLVLTDLIENFEPRRIKNPWLRRLMRWAGAADPDGKAPIDMQLSFWRHRGTVRAAVKAMIAWDPVRMILSHGRWYESDGTAELRRAFRWVL